MNHKWIQWGTSSVLHDLFKSTRTPYDHLWAYPWITWRHLWNWWGVHWGINSVLCNLDRSTRTPQGNLGIYGISKEYAWTFMGLFMESLSTSHCLAADGILKDTNDIFDGGNKLSTPSYRISRVQYVLPEAIYGVQWCLRLMLDWLSTGEPQKVYVQPQRMGFPVFPVFPVFPDIFPTMEVWGTLT